MSIKDYTVSPLAYFQWYRRMRGGKWVACIHPFNFMCWVKAPIWHPSWDCNEDWTGVGEK
jgi:hypothetical protein